jgi:hypothetical protein
MKLQIIAVGGKSKLILISKIQFAQDVPTERNACFCFFYLQDVPTGHEYKTCPYNSFMSRRDIL